MRSGLLALVGVVTLALGLAALALTAYLWFGDWPATLKEAVETQRSVAATEHAPPPPLVGHASGRAHTDLGGRWQAVIDPIQFPAVEFIAPQEPAAPAPSDIVEFTFQGGLELDVPGDWNTQDPRLFFYRGVVWYRRTFEHEPSPGRRSFLWFGAVNYEASVYVNGRRVIRHEGGFTPFNVEVTDLLREGENWIVVRVDNENDPQDIPTRNADWLNYGGITRRVLLLDVPDTFVRATSVGLAPDGSGIEAWAQLDGPDAAGGAVRLEIPELGVSETATADATGRATFSVAARPERWSPESPRLYDVTLASADDRVEEPIGFRTFRAAEGELLLNDVPVFLRGISLHEEAAHGAGRIHSEAQAREILGWARDLGANFVRLSHYPHNDHMARLADAMGLLVWAEIPVYWNVDFDDPDTLALGKQQLSELIERDRNRASVVLWSIANETPISDARNAFLQALTDHVHDLDPTRPVTAALLTGPELLAPFAARLLAEAGLGLSGDTWTLDVDDPLGAIVDVPALNEYFGWYYAPAVAQLTPFDSHELRRIVLDHLPAIRLRTGLGKPLIISEFGAGALAGLRAPEDELVTFSEDYQALVYRRQLEMLALQDEVRGLSPWILKDFRSPMRMYQGVQDYWNRKGLVDDDGTRKQAFEVLRDHYTDRAAEAGP